MSRTCDHKMIGVIVRNDAGILLLKKTQSPYGYACVSGHLDNFGSAGLAAVAILKNKTGLHATTVRSVYQRWHKDQCHREFGTEHFWQVFIAEVPELKLNLNPLFANGFVWADKAKIKDLTERTQAFNRAAVTREDWRKNPGIDPTWADIIHRMGERAYTTTADPLKSIKAWVSDVVKPYISKGTG